ncbi:Lysine-specific demethylase 2B-like protein [Dinothrombium tinctorium]|uniref:Lysine-specific demethylase 2B-like protein n=1 Tax=Dinothrombium tinctorium TaxID=1965070 RepID=A0A443RM21_9ACAR|nr:Lysine-specific demethylase 2B-like protein [Dinothrombium tinctorium]
MRGEDLNLRHFQEYGFDSPILVKQKIGLGLKMPDKSFTVNDVKQCVGSRRVVDVMDVSTQKNIEMTVKEWCRYYENPKRERLLNVISLEFSHTKLETMVESPTIVRQVDWVDWVWPKHLKHMQTESTNSIEDMKYPKQLRIAQVEDVTKVPSKFRYPFYSEILWYVIQRYVYCLTGKNHLNCNEDGLPNNESTASGTLSSYSNHVSKVRNPSEAVHLTPYELNGLKAIIMWLSRLSTSKRSVPELIANPEALLNDAKLLVDDHTNDDNRLACTGKSVLFWSSKHTKPTTNNSSSSHSGLSVTAQLRQIKNSFTSLKHTTTSKLNFSHNAQSTDGSPQRPESPPTRPLSSNQYTVNAKLTNKPLDQIPSSFAELIAATEVGNQTKLSVSPNTTLNSSTSSSSSTTSTMTQTAPLTVHQVQSQDIVSSIISKDVYPKASTNNNNNSAVNNSQSNKSVSASDSSRRRRTRCKKCEACLRADCGECHFCKDMKKFGGPGRMKQSCIARQCMAPVLPHTACCMICGRDGWEKLNTANAENDAQSSLMECSKCWEIAHPICLKEKNSFSMQEGIISEELPNSWECPKCVLFGKQNVPIKQRQNKQGSQSSSTSVPAFSSSTNTPVVKIPVTNSFITFSSSDGPNKKAYEDEMPPGSESETDDNSSNSENCNMNSNNNSVERSTFSNSSLQQSTNPISPTSTVTSVVRSCARFPLLQEAIKQQQQEQQKSSSSNLKSIKPHNESKSSVLKVKRSNETSRDRLFRSLKGLKKSSELMRFSSTLSHSQVQVAKKAVSRLNSSCQNYSKPESETSLNSDLVIVDNHRVKSEKGDTKRGFMADITSKSEPHIFTEDTDNDTDENEELQMQTSAKYSSSTSSSSEEESVENNEDKKRPLTEGLHQKSNRPLIKPKYVVRPAPLPEDISESDEEEREDEEEEDSDGEKEKQKAMKRYFKKFRKKKNENLSLERDVILPVLPYLCRRDLINCMLVCKVWNGWCLDPKLWKKLDLTRKKITSNSLMGLVRRQPLDLNISWSNISKRQLSWLIARLPQLQALSLAGCSSTILPALCTCNCPLLRVLDLSWVDSLCDNIIRELLSPPLDSRPGLMETKTRLRHLTEIRLAGTDISDISIRLMSHHLPQLASLDLSSCQKVTDMGIAVLGAAKSSKLTSLKLSSCSHISDTSLDALKRCQNLKILDLRDCNQVTINACHKFIMTVNSKSKLQMRFPKLLETKTQI